MKKTKKNLSELFNGIRGIVDNPGDQNIDPDTAWFKDLQNRRDLHRENPNAFAHYAPKTDTPQFPIVCPRTGKPSVSIMLKSLAQALYIQANDPRVEGIDDIIHKLEKIIVDYREDLTEIPEYRVDIVKSKDVTTGLNNLIYGPYEPNTNLACMVSDMTPNSNLNLSDVKVNVTPNETSTHSVNGVADRVNVVQKSNDGDLANNDIDDMLSDIQNKTKELIDLRRREEERTKQFTG